MAVQVSFQSSDQAPEAQHAFKGVSLQQLGPSLYEGYGFEKTHCGELEIVYFLKKQLADWSPEGLKSKSHDPRRVQSMWQDSPETIEERCSNHTQAAIWSIHWVPKWRTALIQTNIYLSTWGSEIAVEEISSAAREYLSRGGALGFLKGGPGRAFQKDVDTFNMWLRLVRAFYSVCLKIYYEDEQKTRSDGTAARGVF